jgi:hypothetical protein
MARKRRHSRLGHRRQPVLQLLVFLVGLVLAFLVDLEEAFELEHRTGGAEQVVGAVVPLGGHVDGGLVEQRRHHLAATKRFQISR